MNNRWHDTPIPECECGICTWCHDAYEHHWYECNGSIETWDCRDCQEQYWTFLAASLKSGECEYHDKTHKECNICIELQSRIDIDNSIDRDIDHHMEVKHENN